jgi:stalled ribosome rescue protein Dom34
MTTHNKKQFGVWMDSHHATVTGKAGPESKAFVVLGHVKNRGADRNSNENAANHQEIALTHKFFKEIAAIMPNVDELHVTGTGQVQEQFIHFLADTPQYKNTACTESTSNKMGDEQLAAFIGKHYNG